jgi:hypothetical protein
LVNYVTSCNVFQVTDLTDDHILARKHLDVVDVEELFQIAKQTLSLDKKKRIQLILSLDQHLVDISQKAWKKAYKTKNQEDVMKTIDSGGAHHSLTAKDILRLSNYAGSNWLTDPTMDLWFQILADQYPGIKSARTQFVEGMHNKLVDQQDKKAVLSWKLKHESLFNAGRFMIPVPTGSHWFLLIVTQNHIEVYDSLAGKPSFLIAQVAEDLEKMFPDKRWGPYAVTQRVFHPEGGLWCPQQGNLYDCGVFTCFYALFLAAGLPMTFSQAYVDTFRMRMTAMLITYGDEKAATVTSKASEVEELPAAEVDPGADGGKKANIRGNDSGKAKEATITEVDTLSSSSSDEDFVVSNSQKVKNSPEARGGGSSPGKKGGGKKTEPPPPPPPPRSQLTLPTAAKTEVYTEPLSKKAKISGKGSGKAQEATKTEEGKGGGKKANTAPPPPSSPPLENEDSRKSKRNRKSKI